MDNSLIVKVVTCFAAILATLCSILSLLVINRLKSNLLEHLLLVKYLVYCELIFRVMFPWGFLFTLSDDESIILNMCRLPFSFGEAVLSTILCASCFYTIMYQKQLHAEQYLVQIIGFIITLTILIFLVVVVPYLVDPNLVPTQVNVVGNVRTFFALMDVLIVTSILIKLRSIVSRGPRMSEIDKVLRTLSHRIVFYPIVQIISRSGNIWYYFQAEWTDINPNVDDPNVFASIMYLSFCCFFANFGVLVILLIMQPTAFQHFCALLQCAPLTLPPTPSHASNSISQAERSNFSIFLEDADLFHVRNAMDDNRTDEELYFMLDGSGRDDTKFDGLFGGSGSSIWNDTNLDNSSEVEEQQIRKKRSMNTSVLNPIRKVSANKKPSSTEMTASSVNR